MTNITDKIFCFIGLHNWFYGCFQTGKKSEHTGDHIGVNGRVCLDCHIKQKRVKSKYLVVKEWKRDD